MNILVKERKIVAAAEKISYGIYDEAFYKWRLADSEDRLLCYMIDNGFSLIEGVTLPEDYEEGKYIYEGEKFVLNENWKPYHSVEEQLDMLKKENDDRIECEADILYELSLLQLGLI